MAVLFKAFKALQYLLKYPKMRLHTFCGLPLQAGIIVTGLFCTVSASTALGGSINLLLRGDYPASIYTSRDAFLDYMSVKCSILALIVLVSLLQFIGGVRESQNLTIPFLVCSGFLAFGLVCDQIIGASFGLRGIREFRAAVTPVVILLFFIWMNLSYMTHMRLKFLESVNKQCAGTA